jgi:hypothetical protein
MSSTITPGFTPKMNKTLTSGSATGIATLTMANATMAGGLVRWTVRATDGTNVQASSGLTDWSLVQDSSGVLTNNINTSVTAPAVPTGTLTVSWTFSGATLQITATSSLTVTLLDVTLTIENNSQQTFALVP